jgi:hypothetical protein
MPVDQEEWKTEKTEKEAAAPVAWFQSDKDAIM